MLARNGRLFRKVSMLVSMKKALLAGARAETDNR